MWPFLLTLKLRIWSPQVGSRSFALCFVCCLCITDNISERNTDRLKDLFWFLASEGPAQGRLAPWTRAELQWKNGKGNPSLASFGHEVKWGGGPRNQNILPCEPGDAPRDLPPARPYFLRFTESCKTAPPEGDWVLIHDPVGTGYSNQNPYYLHSFHRSAAHGSYATRPHLRRKRTL